MKSTGKILILFLIIFSFQTVKADWVKQKSNTLAWLYDIYFIDENQGWIAGSNGTLLGTDDGGKSWEKLINFTQDNIKQVYFVDKSNGWLLCERNIYNRGTKPPSYLLKTSDGGISWETVNFAGNGRERIAKLFFDKRNTGWAIGEAGALFTMQSDKITWKKNPPPTGYLMLDGIFTDSLTGTIACAGGSVVFTEDSGSTWMPATFAQKSDSKLNSLFFIKNKTGWAVGNKGKIYQSLNGGKFWHEQNSTVKVNLNDVFFNDSSNGWAVGEEGKVLHTKTAGNIWVLEDIKSTYKLEKVYFTKNKGWIVGFGGLIMSYEVNEAAKSTLKPILNRGK